MPPEQLKAHLSNKLAAHLPSNTAELIAHWVLELNVTFVVSKPRQSKFGDFRPSLSGKKHRISVNSDLNKFAFLITTIHEFAHLGCWLKHKNAVSPHGSEWKTLFSRMLKPFVERQIFPSDIVKALNAYIKNPKASSCSSPDLMRALKNYDKPGNTMLLENLPEGQLFDFQGKKFYKLEKRRTRYLCKSLANKRLYLISGIADVTPLTVMGD